MSRNRRQRGRALFRAVPLPRRGRFLDRRATPNVEPIRDTFPNMSNRLATRQLRVMLLHGRLFDMMARVSFGRVGRIGLGRIFGPVMLVTKRKMTSQPATLTRHLGLLVASSHQALKGAASPAPGFLAATVAAANHFNLRLTFVRPFHELYFHA